MYLLSKFKSKIKKNTFLRTSRRTLESRVRSPSQDAKIWAKSEFFGKQHEIFGKIKLPTLDQ